MSWMTFPCTSVSRKSRPAVAIRQLLVIDTEEIENRRVQIVHVHRVLHRFEAEIVRCAVDRAALDAASGEPDGEAEGVVVELGCAKHEGLLEEPARLEIFEESGEWLVDISCVPTMFENFEMEFLTRGQTKTPFVCGGPEPHTNGSGR